MKKILFLHSELSGYLVACLTALVRNYPVAVYVIHWPVNPDAPFKFDDKKGICLNLKGSRQETVDYAEKLSPDLIVVSGWRDRDYLLVCRKFRGKIPIVCCADNQWRGTLKQRISTLAWRKLQKRHYSHFWVPGLHPNEYIRRLKVPEEKIMTGLYSGDFELFNRSYMTSKWEKDRRYPHTMLYVGRLTKEKGISNLMSSFLELETDWKLIIAGMGPLMREIPKNERIMLEGFVQPSDMTDLVKRSGAFILPSKEEPWGVVLHEFAAAGLPLICSDACGAAEAFVKEGVNGFIFRADDRNSLKKALKKMVSTTDKELTVMGEKSAELSKQITPEKWAKTLWGVLLDGKT